MVFTFPLKKPLERRAFKEKKMQMINLASVSRKKGDKNKNYDIVYSKLPQVLNRIEDFKNIIVLSGTAKRESINKKEKYLSDIKIVEKNSIKKNFLKLRAPPYKSHHKKVHAEDKLMTKSCEILFECIRPYKNISVARKPQVTESETIGSIFKTNAVIYERKATRKIQFFTFSEEMPSECFIWDERQTSGDSLRTDPFGFNIRRLEVQNATNSLTATEEEADQGKTISSEDFITKVFSETGLL